MKIEKNKVVVITYDLDVDGVVVDQAGEDNPLDYIHGTHCLLPKFEEAVEGLDEGDAFSFTLSPDDGYGPYEEKKCFDVPRTAFTIGDEIREDLMQVGKIVPMINSSGHVVNATIVAVKADGVTLDFNHPMAGKTLHFSGKVQSVRDASEKELLEGLHGEFLPPEDDCCCGHHHHHGDGDDCCCGHHHHHHSGHCHHEGCKQEN